MAIPPLAPLPPANVRSALSPEEWEASLDAWLTLSELNLRLPNKEFQSEVREDGALATFLISFYQQSTGNDDRLNHDKIQSLRKICFVLIKRIFTTVSIYSQDLLSWDFLSTFCHAHLKRPALKELMSTLWTKRSESLIALLQKRKNAMIKALESSSNAYALDLSQLAPLIYASPDIGQFFMTGSDFTDSLISSYESSDEVRQRKILTSIMALGLEALVLVAKPNTSLLTEQLYSLWSQADKSPGTQSLMADVVTNTSALARLQRHTSANAPERLSNLISTLETYRSPSIARPKRHIRKKSGKAAVQPDEAMHFHRMTLVTQIQDLFPDLGSGFILKALDAYDDDIEQVTAHLLEDSLPPHLSSLDRSLQAPTPPQPSTSSLAPRSTPPPPPPPQVHEPFIPTRANVFDTDDLLSHPSNLHIGKKPLPLSPSSAPSGLKSSILSALSAFDSDDDERDDTYDVDDVGGTVDTSSPPDGEAPSSTSRAELDTLLFATYKSHPELFSRAAEVRRGQARAALRAQTGLADEAIEGWAVMLVREPGRVRRLEAQMMDGGFDGRQRELPGSSYRENEGSKEDTEGSAGETTGMGGRGGGRGRGRGRGGRGRGGRGRGDVAGPSGDPGTAAAQRRKEANKGSRANHNRREGRARKMARGGFGP